MSTWRYVFARETHPLVGDWWSIREFYEFDDGTTAWTEKSITAGGETPKELSEDLMRMLNDEDKVFLDLTLDNPCLVPYLSLKETNT